MDAIRTTRGIRRFVLHGLIFVVLSTLCFADSGSSRSSHRWVSDVEELLHPSKGEANTYEEKGVTLSEQFIYVYDVPTEFNVDLMDLEPAWWSSQYEGELQIYQMIKEKGIGRTNDPEKAALFYVPFFFTRYLHVIFKQFISYDDNREWNNIDRGFNETSVAFAKVLKKIRSKYPYFNRNGGKDHFSVLTHDHGRCSALTFMDPNLYGEMFFLTLNGDKMVRSTHGITTRGMQVLTYDWRIKSVCNVPDIPCYMSDRDIVVPPGPIHLAEEKSSPWEHDRNVTALFRFSAIMDHFVLIPFWHHHVRTELYKIWANKSVDGFDFGVKTEAESEGDWERSKFCVCPPGHSQWTSRFPKAILAGCIPITFYREHDNPWQDDIDYELFSINIDVDAMDTLKDRIEEVLNNPGRLRVMQQELVRVQDLFLWGHGHGIWSFSLRMLRRRAKIILKKQLRVEEIFKLGSAKPDRRRLIERSERQEDENIFDQNQKFIYYSGEGEDNVHYDKKVASLLCMLKEANYFNRTLVMDADWGFGRKGNEQDVRLYLDMEQINRRQKTVSKSKFLKQWKFWGKKNAGSNIDVEYLNLKFSENPNYKDSGATILQRGLVFGNGDTSCENYFGETKMNFYLPWSLPFSPLLMKIANEIAEKMRWDFDSIQINQRSHVFLPLRKMIGSSQHRNAQLERLSFSVKQKISPNRTLYVAKNKRENISLRDFQKRVNGKNLRDFNYLWRRGSEWWKSAKSISGGERDPVFDSEMEKMVDSIVWTRGSTKLKHELV